MTEERRLLRQYLLGRLNPDGRRAVEERLFKSPDYLDEMLICEDELIDGYIGGSLPAEEAEAFDRHFLLSLERRQKLLFARALKRYVAASAVGRTHAREVGVTRGSGALWPRAFAGRLPRPAFYAPLAAALLLLVVYGSWHLLVERWQRAALEAELRELNEEQARVTEGPTSAPGQAFFTLSPGLLRGAGDAAELAPAADARIIRLRLNLPSDEFQSYEALLQTADDANNTGVAVNGLRASGEGDSRAVVVNLPAALLPDGEYRLALKGTDEGGAAEDVATYHFRVRRRRAT